MFHLPVTFSLQFLHSKPWPQTAERFLSRWTVLAMGGRAATTFPQLSWRGDSVGNKLLLEWKATTSWKAKSPSECMQDAAQTGGLLRSLWNPGKGTSSTVSSDHTVLSAQVSQNLSAFLCHPENHWYRHCTIHRTERCVQPQRIHGHINQDREEQLGTGQPLGVQAILVSTSAS